GQGAAGSGSGGATLVTGRAKTIPPYFVGHWVEVRDGATGALEGRWRIASIGLDGRTVFLASNSGEPVTVDEGDTWQGVYLFDRYTVRGQLQVLSADPVRVFSEQVITGVVETGAIRAGRLVIESGGLLMQHLSPSSTAPESLTIEVGELVVKAGGAIDVSSRGYASRVTYPAHGGSNGEAGGSHLGEGGPDGTPPETFGSVYFPQENGSGGNWDGRGGGTVKIVAERVQVDGAIRANGETDTTGGAGGSVWIRTSALAGSGTIEAKGGSSTSCCSDGSGGGGAIAVDYGTLESGSTLLANLKAQGGTTQTQGGAGTIHVKSGADSYGELIVDNTGVNGNRRTILPALGKGTAQVGSGGARLVTGRSKAIPAYFVGHWVEVRNGATGAVEGTWRIDSIGADALTVTLASNAGEPVTVDEGDSWQGLYRFDRYSVRGQLKVLSTDPIHVFSEQVITGTVETDSIRAESLVVEPGAVLTQYFTPSSSSPQALTIEVGELVVKAGGAIDVSGRGYPATVTYPGHTAPGGESGGSHLGEGGPDGPAGQTFGSVTFPRENGGGGRWIGRGGGAVKIVADRVQVDGVIRANGETQTSGGAGGSVWIKTAALAGSGSIEARGGSSSSCCSDGSGGGGAISIEYGSLDSASTLLDHLTTQGGSTQTTGGAGTIYLYGPGANLGSLTVDNKTVTGNRRTLLPPLGRGIVQPGSSGGTVITGRDTNVPGYFAGSWVEVEGPDRIKRGVWRIASVNGTTITLEPRATQPFTIAPGDRWRGVYRFDAVTIASGAVLVSTDPVIQLVPPLAEASRAKADTAGAYESLYGNDEAPAWERAAVAVAVGTVPGSYRITLGSAAVSDPDGLSEVRLTSGSRSLAADWTASGVTFLWAGRPGQQLHLVATDAHGRFRRSGWLELPPLPAGGWEPQLELADGVTPLALTGGADWLALAGEGIWLYGEGTQPTDVIPPKSADEEVLALAADDRFLFVATRGRLDLLDREAQSVAEVPVTAGTLVDVVADDVATGEATVLLADTSDPENPALRLSRLLSDGEAPALSAPGDAVLPVLAAPSLHRTAGYLHLLGLQPEGGGAIYTWPSSAPGEPLLTSPQTFAVPAGWSATGPWERGAVLVQGTSVALFEHGASGWAEVSRIELEAAATAAAVSGNTLVVLLPGEILTFDVTTATAPALLARHPGSSYQAVEPLPGGDVALWSPRMATPPLRWNPATAAPGEGFLTVLDGLP
ncbi:MAG TPA: hypothetical protein VLT87_07265, partial [Thermoanaerobaculia bacterium]|nr:hypothetical protein [Thermoanaerobaculia bacterium]